MLGERSVVLDVEGFRYKKNAFVVKELAITFSDYSDRLIFLPPVNFNILPKLEQKAYNWLTNYLHGLHLENGDYLYINLNQILQTFVLRNPGAVFYAKGKEKTEFLAKYLDRKLEMNWAVLGLKSYFSKIFQVAMDIYLIKTYT